VLIIAVDPANLPLPPFNINMYSAFIEKNDVDSKITEEILEFYDGTNDIAIAVNTLDGIRTVTYSYAKIDELLLVSGKIFCFKILFSKLDFILSIHFNV